MKIRIGYAPGAREPERDDFTGLCRSLEELGFDSLWVTERATGPGGDPVALLAHAGAVTERIKLGTAVMTLPGRQPALLAQQLATLDHLSGGRLLPAFGLGQRLDAEHQAFGVARGERVALFEELLPLLRRFWSGERVTHDGPRFSFDGVAVRPTPVRGAFDVWMGGTADAELRRAGRLADGWLAAFVTPAEAERGRLLIERTAAEHGRSIDPEHFGVTVAYRHGDAPAALRVPRPGLSDADLAALVPSLDALDGTLTRYIEAGFSKFVLAPLHSPADWRTELTALRDVLALQT
ncbi:LLM class flavin-dependent oxidoreductase [Actinocorallia sp. A-T 12471]|uniref:LLM class flavin-dependent oxidoreductase n=1 Tax=Actinocorallia sp. A-T 12471 TaxID=3089813 RepID=UPI0029CD89D2|nr:LLM class flavin-dependent oxidoreductase [Actinocorallia sp. A-T 12471]MDX6740768.1 LLM class flavin-dependent oxidoreductase [Actinocorallia sp. A-T 12471]